MNTDQQRIIYLASHNKHKKIELQALAGNSFDIRDLSDFSPKIIWNETGDTFYANAKIKALAVRERTSCAVLADDSGLSVTSLDGAPGVYSSRYGGIEGDDANNNKKLLNELKNQPNCDRSAQFLCALVFIDEKGKESKFEGSCTGSIGHKNAGSEGFGYDPLFIPTAYEKSLAELGEQIKNKISHRSKAVTLWCESQAK